MNILHFVQMELLLRQSSPCDAEDGKALDLADPLPHDSCNRAASTLWCGVVRAQSIFFLFDDELLEPPDEHHQDNYQLTFIGPPADKPI